MRNDATCLAAVQVWLNCHTQERYESLQTIFGAHIPFTCNIKLNAFVYDGISKQICGTWLFVNISRTRRVECLELKKTD